MRRSGWLTFSAVVLITAEIMRVIDAIWAFGYHAGIPYGLHGALLGHSLKTGHLTALRASGPAAPAAVAHADAASSPSPSRMKRVAPTERKKPSACWSWSSASACRPSAMSS